MFVPVQALAVLSSLVAVMTDSDGHRFEDLPVELSGGIAGFLDQETRKTLAHRAKVFRYVMDYGTLEFLVNFDDEKIQSFVRFSASAVTFQFPPACSFAPFRRCL